MLLNITVENFRSYNEAQTLSLLASDSEAISPEVNSVKIGEYYIRKSAVIYGANASGKSNIIKAVSTLIDILNNDINQPNRFPPNPVYHPFFKNEKPTLISLDFSIRNQVYTYSINYDDKSIYLEELLDEQGNPIFSRRPAFGLSELIADYAYDIPKENLILSHKQLESGLLKQIQLSTSEKRTFLRQCVDEYNGKLLEPILVYLRGILFRLNSYSVIGKPTVINNDLNYAANYFRENNMQDSVVKSLNSIGANLQDLEVKYNKENPVVGDMVNGVRGILAKYIISGKECELDFLNDESDGTVKFYNYLALIDSIIQNDGILLVDELETHFHPLLVEEIIRAVHNSDSRAQLIFTTHNPILLDESIFERDQIYFTEKNAKQATALYSLVDFSDLEDTPNLTAKYMAGRLGAIPYINSLSFRKRSND